MAATHLPQQDHDMEDDGYVSSEDEDFNPEDGVGMDVDEASEDGGDDTGNAAAAAADGTSKKQGKPKGRRKKSIDNDGEAEDLGFENSGDEAMVKQGRKRKKRGKEEDSGGEGGFVKTRSMRAVEKEEKEKPLASTAGATIDVEALWQAMNSKDVAPLPSILSQAADNATTTLQESTTAANNGITSSLKPATSKPSDKQDMIIIKKTYTFAGEPVTETLTVSRLSAEAQAYLRTLRPQPKCTPPGYTAANRPLRFRSRFQPLIAETGKTDATAASGTGAGAKGKKLNVVDKSKLDWNHYVETQGMTDELVKAGKRKGGYLDREEFLGRVQAEREVEARRLRIGGSK
ncbi:hypothetical protein MMC25_003991 [Agyrium rufum]|nr:hypothetical protein [Agyrium rufum]